MQRQRREAEGHEGGVGDAVGAVEHKTLEARGNRGRGLEGRAGGTVEVRLGTHVESARTVQRFGDSSVPPEQLRHRRFLYGLRRRGSHARNVAAPGRKRGMAKIAFLVSFL